MAVQDQWTLLTGPMRFRSLVLATCLLLSRAAAALAQSGPDPAEHARVLVGSAAFGDWRADAPLIRRKITADDLPKPFITRSANNPPRIIPRPYTASPKVPPGFQAELFASQLKDPRALVVAPNGDVFVAESEPGRIRVLRGEAKLREKLDKDGKPLQGDAKATYLERCQGSFSEPAERG
jgi:glucose/arabinose dehydrogenase